VIFFEALYLLFYDNPQTFLERGSPPLRLLAYHALMKFVPLLAVDEL